MAAEHIKIAPDFGIVLSYKHTRKHNTTSPFGSPGLVYPSSLDSLCLFGSDVNISDRLKWTNTYAARLHGTRGVQSQVKVVNIKVNQRNNELTSRLYTRVNLLTTKTGRNTGNTWAKTASTALMDHINKRTIQYDKDSAKLDEHTKMWVQSRTKSMTGGSYRRNEENKSSTDLLSSNISHKYVSV